MKRKTATIKAGSCSRPARAQKRLGACAQVNPAAMVPPSGVAKALFGVLTDFQGGMSMYQVATKWKVRVHTVEDLIRRALRVSV